MGFYDLRCAITGLSLLGQSCDVLLLRRRAGRLEPIWGCVTGRYNRLGTIDDPPAAAAELTHLGAALATLAREGRLVEEGDVVSPGEPFFERFEPNRHRVRLDGDEVVLTLFHHRVVQHLVREHGDEHASPEALFDTLFSKTGALAPYASVGLGPGLRRLHALRSWLGSRPIPVPRDAEQHGPAEVARSIRDAKKRAPLLIDAIEWAEAEDYRR